MQRLRFTAFAILAALCAIAATSQEAKALRFWHHGYRPCDYGRYSAGYQYYFDDNADYHYYEAIPVYSSGLKIIPSARTALRKGSLGSPASRLSWALGVLAGALHSPTRCAGRLT